MRRRACGVTSSGWRGQSGGDGGERAEDPVIQRAEMRRIDAVEVWDRRAGMHGKTTTTSMWLRCLRGGWILLWSLGKGGCDGVECAAGESQYLVGRGDESDRSF